MEFNGSGGVDMAPSDGNSRLHDKIGVVQQVLTLLENTMSSAKSTHQQNQASYLTRIEELELQILNLKKEMQRDKDDFSEISESLGNNIQKYLNLENQLLTIEERSHDDYIQLPELNTSTDIYVGQYLPHEYTDWQRLKLQCQFLNQTTQNDFRENICVTRYQVSVEADSESTQRYIQTVEKANALNLIRGKRFLPPSPSRQSSFVTLTWYRNEIAAKNYAQKNYSKIIEQVLKDQYEKYKGKSISVTEVRNNTDELEASLATELTIHVQAKTSTFNAQNIMPRRITLYQFDETTTYSPPAVTTFSIETAPAPTVEIDSGVVASCSNTAFVYENQTNNPREIKQKNKTKTPRPKSRRSPNKQCSKSVDDVLSLIGLNDDTVIIESTNATALSEVCNLQRNSPISKVPDNAPLVPYLDTISDQVCMAFDGVKMSECALNYIRNKGIKKLSESQKQLIHSLLKPGDILYEAVSNGGDITAMTIGLLNCIDLNPTCVQALIITANSKSSKLVQKEYELLAGTLPSVTCQTLDEFFHPEEPNRNNESRRETLKTAKRPSSNILIGTLLQMKILVLKNLFHKSSIRFLILHNAEEIYGSVIFNQKENALSINKIIYALDAKVKVIVVRHNTAKCSELDAFCELKLREKQFIKESVEVPEFTERTGHISDGGRKSSAGSDSDSRLRRTSHSSTDSSQISEVYPSTSKSGNIDSDSASVLSVDSTVEGNLNSEKCEEPEWRTLISEHATQLLGISKNIGNKAAKRPEDLGDDIAHLFANIENGDESSKIDMLSMLNLEEDKAIIFCDSIDKAEWISTRLRQKQLWPQVLHENVLPKDQRVILQNYRQGNLCRVLICTDFVLSISLDSADVVLNFDLPQSKSSYISRAAFALRHIRKAKTSTGTAKGVVVNLVLNDYHKLKEFEKSLGITIHNCDD